MNTFSFPCPDGTIQILDLKSVFPAGANSVALRSYGISLTEKYPEYTEKLASWIREEAARIDEPVSEKLAERIGISLGLKIYKHLLRSEEYGDIWAEVAEAYERRFHQPEHPNIFFISGGEVYQLPTEIVED